MTRTAMTLKEKAYAALRERILTGDLKPGDELTERMLVESLGMSRTPIRAALERLDVEGLARYTPNKGLVVAELSLRKAIDLYDYRIAIEGFIARKLSRSELDADDAAWFEANLREQQAACEADDYARFTEADAQFHRKLSEVYGNSEMIAAMEQLQDKLYRIALQVLKKDRSRIRVSYEDHARIIEAIRRGDTEEAAARMEEHLEFGKRILIS